VHAGSRCSDILPWTFAVNIMACSFGRVRQDHSDFPAAIPSDVVRRSHGALDAGHESLWGMWDGSAVAVAVAIAIAVYWPMSKTATEKAERTLSDRLRSYRISCWNSFVE